MANNHSTEGHATRRGGMPLAIAIAVAILGVLGMLIVDHGPWNKPHVKTAAVGNAARNAGATVVPTEPKRWLEPDAPNPKPVHPANPAPPAGDF